MKIKKAAFVIGWLLGSVAYAQETREVTERDNVFTERFSVLKADKHSKQGGYERYFRETLIEKGNYNQGQRVGLWEFYDLSGKLDQTFDYTTRQIQYSANYNQPDSLQTLYKIISGSDTTYTRLAKPPVPIGGNSQLSRTLMMNLRYPISAQRAGKQGVVIVAYLVDDTGKFRPARVLRSSGEADMDAEALRVINLYSALQWIPAEWKERNVSTFITQPVRFSNMGVVNRPR
jgi:TonB family protein